MGTASGAAAVALSQQLRTAAPVPGTGALKMYIMKMREQVQPTTQTFSKLRTTGGEGGGIVSNLEGLSTFQRCATGIAPNDLLRSTHVSITEQRTRGSNVSTRTCRAKVTCTVLTRALRTPAFPNRMRAAGCSSTLCSRTLNSSSSSSSSSKRQRNCCSGCFAIDRHPEQYACADT
jgi:hypothetical protein